MKKSIVAVLLAAVLCCLCACSGNENTEEKNYALKPVSSMPVFEDDGSYQYYLGGWNAPSTTNPEAIRIMSECGINHIMMNSSTTDADTMKKIIDNCGQYGVKAYPLMSGRVVATPEEFFNHAFDDYLTKEGLAGFTYYDEPMSDKFDSFQRLIDNHNEKYPELDFFINLYSSYYYDDLPDQNTASSYMEYVMMYCSKVLSKLEGKRILSADHYPLRWSKATQNNFYICPTWLQTCEAIAENAKNYDAMSHFYLTTTEHYDYRKPTEERLRFEVNVYMTYGAQGLSAFGYAGDVSGEDPKKFEDSMVSASGIVIRPFYYVAQKINREILAWDHVFLRYDWQGVMQVLGEGNESNVLFDKSYMSLKSLPNVDYVSASGDSLIGYFTDSEGQPAYMLTNVGDPDIVKENDVINISVTDATDAIIYSHGEAKNVKMDQGSLSVELAPGEAVFVIPVNLVENS